MANRYWIDVSGVAGWDDGVVGVATPWASTSGGSDNVAKPANGDSVYFDANSPTAPTGGPAADVALARFDTTDFAGTGDLGGATNSHVRIASGGVLLFTFAGGFVGTLLSGSTGTVSGGSGAFNGSASSATLTISNGATIGSGTISGGILNLGTAVVSTGSTVTPTTCNITGTVSGDGAISATTIAISGSGTNSIPLTGTVTITGASATNYATVTGNVTLVSGGQNSGVITGNLTAPYSTAAGAYGSWSGSLTLTGLPSSGSVLPIVLA